MSKKLARHYMGWVEHYLSVKEYDNAWYYLVKAYKAYGWISQEYFEVLTDNIN